MTPSMCAARLEDTAFGMEGAFGLARQGGWKCGLIMKIPGTRAILAAPLILAEMAISVASIGYAPGRSGSSAVMTSSSAAFPASVWAIARWSAGFRSATLSIRSAWPPRPSATFA